MRKKCLLNAYGFIRITLGYINKLRPIGFRAVMLKKMVSKFGVIKEAAGEK